MMVLGGYLERRSRAAKGQRGSTHGSELAAATTLALEEDSLAAGFRIELG